jgi:hypothetical protein
MSVRSLEDILLYSNSCRHTYTSEIENEPNRAKPEPSFWKCTRTEPNPNRSSKSELEPNRTRTDPQKVSSNRTEPELIVKIE